MKKLFISALSLTIVNTAFATNYRCNAIENNVQIYIDESAQSITVENHTEKLLGENGKVFIKSKDNPNIDYYGSDNFVSEKGIYSYLLVGMIKKDMKGILGVFNSATNKPVGDFMHLTCKTTN